MSVRLFPYCFVLLLAAFAPGVPGIAAATTEFMVLNDYAQAWADKQEWVYEGMQESDEPVPHREGDAWNQEDSSGLTVLDYALLGASAQELGAVQSMVQLGARPGTGKAEAYLGPTLNLARLAVRKAPLEEWRSTINFGGTNKILPNGFTPLLWAAVFQPDASVLHALIKGGADPKKGLPEEAGGQNILHIVAEQGWDPQAVHILIDAGLDVDAVTNPQMMGETPFMVAVRRNQNPQVIKALLERGADTEVRDSQGQRAWEGLWPEREAWLKDAGLGWLWDNAARQKRAKRERSGGQAASGIAPPNPASTSVEGQTQNALMDTNAPGIQAPLVSNAMPDESMSVQALITDSDRMGTNVRDAPSGKIIATIPFPVNNELPDDEKLTRRVVTLLEERKGWFKVLYYGDKQGWMHKSVLGAYACATEDGDARLKANPDYNAPKVAILPTDTPLRLLSVRGAWLKVSCTTKTGRNVSGWLPPECVWANPYRHEWR